MASLFVDENELEKFRQSVYADSSRVHYGILVGLAAQAKSEVKTTLVALVSTPCEEQDCPKVFRDFDMDRLAAHGREVSRYLVGGTFVVGFYTVGPAADVDNGAIQAAFKAISSRAGLPLLSTFTSERTRDKFHLHFDTVKKHMPPKAQCLSLSKDGVMRVQPIMLKAQDAHRDRELIVFHTHFALSFTVNSLRPADLASIKSCFERCYPCVEDAPNAVYARDLSGKQIHFFSSTCLSDITGPLLVKGTVAATACVCANSPCSDVYDALKQDAYSSLRFRLDRLHVETDNSKNMDASKQQSLGRRYIVPAFSGGFYISDCITRHESLQTSLASLSDVFPSAIPSDATVIFVEDEELDVQAIQFKAPPAAAALSDAANVDDRKDRPKFNLNIMVIACALLAIALKFFM